MKHESGIKSGSEAESIDAVFMVFQDGIAKYESEMQFSLSCGAIQDALTSSEGLEAAATYGLYLMLDRFYTSLASKEYDKIDKAAFDKFEYAICKIAHNYILKYELKEQLGG